MKAVICNTKNVRGERRRKKKKNTFWGGNQNNCFLNYDFCFLEFSGIKKNIYFPSGFGWICKHRICGHGGPTVYNNDWMNANPLLCISASDTVWGAGFLVPIPKKIALKNTKLSKTNIPVTNCSDYPHKDCIFANFCQHHCQLQHINHYYASLTIWWEENGILLLLPFAFLSSLIDVFPP